ncbi:kinase-like domain-containing protein [Chaetomidium leptoderma]|uniref:non-specific serine/threonine protein kinase n=1 Tax=Chaetomidium leptoderma TaxID=669021 RepID=A0AAN6VHG8_9PEZI|nr:kinase-like domain-containing protein [Chaetomidium leptoderma]
MAKSEGPGVALYREPALMMDEHIESPEHYRPGGYHPVDIGDIITNAASDDTYTVIHKLGYGGFSTVWLANRQRKHPVAGHPLPVSFHALKILRADLDDARADHELRFLQRLGQVGKSSHPNIVVLEDSFTISGPNGQHRCLVFPNSQVPLAFMHSHGICHGDLTPSNVAFTIPGIQTEGHLLEVLGPIKHETLRLRKGPISHSRHAPKKMVAAASFSGLNLGPSSPPSVQIIDFGVAFLTNNPAPTLGCPIEFFPIELLFQCPASVKSDVWQLAAVIFYTYTASYMFQVGFPIFPHLVGFIVQYHGPLPSHWKAKFDWGQYGGVPPGEPVEAWPEPSWWFDGTKSTMSFDDRIAQKTAYLSESQRDELARLFRDMVAWEPTSRISAAEAHRRLNAPIFSSVLGGQ